MDSHHKNPMENHHYIYAHGRNHIDYSIHNIEVAQTPEFFLGLEDFLDYNDLLSATYIKAVSMRLLNKIIYKRPSHLILSMGGDPFSHGNELMLLHVFDFKHWVKIMN